MTCHFCLLLLIIQWKYLCYWNSLISAKNSRSKKPEHSLMSCNNIVFFSPIIFNCLKKKNPSLWRHTNPDLSLLTTIQKTKKIMRQEEIWTLIFVGINELLITEADNDISFNYTWLLCSLDFYSYILKCLEMK